VATLGVRLFTLGIPKGALPYWIVYSLDVRVVSALVAVSAATVFLFALLPAVQGSKADATLVLKEGGRSGTARRGRRWSTIFLAAEFGLAVVLLASFVANMRARTPAVASDRALATLAVLTAEIALPDATYASSDRRSQFYMTLGDRLTAIHTIASVSFATALPLDGGEPRRLNVDGKPTGKRATCGPRARRRAACTVRRRLPELASGCCAHYGAARGSRACARARDRPKPATLPLRPVRPFRRRRLR
jgi:hypothetical protein